ncbi:MAG: hypothetical protein ACLU4J_15625 [Butyricimonas paravirosa]
MKIARAFSAAGWCWGISEERYYNSGNSMVPGGMTTYLPYVMDGNGAFV